MADILTPLTKLDTFINNPAHRATWREVLLAREADKIGKSDDNYTSGRTSRGLSPAVQAAIRQAFTDAEGMLELAQLAEKFAASTRTRLTVTLADLRPDADDQDRESCETEAQLILTGVQEIMRDLTEARFVDPGEASGTAKAALYDLTNELMAIKAEMTLEDLRWWSTRVGRAMRVITAAPRVETAAA
ncbi:hypothetical protein ACFWNL_18260 [Kitasatospora sp. NPDC058397]|uniref:hypothetical protein n=1 Tax=unclassified Kitasatospora TaxID=2633591 RepID=UPI00364707E1